jgi:hypothetical protein
LIDYLIFIQLLAGLLDYSISFFVRGIAFF